MISSARRRAARLRSPSVLASVTYRNDRKIPDNMSVFLMQLKRNRMRKTSAARLYHCRFDEFVLHLALLTQLRRNWRGRRIRIRRWGWPRRGGGRGGRRGRGPGPGPSAERHLHRET